MNQTKPSPIPDGQIMTPYLIVKDGAKAMEFYARAFGAVETLRLAEPSGKVSHAEMAIGRARFMLADEHPEIECIGPATLGGTTVSLSVYVADVDAFAARAVAAGATVVRPIADEFYGERVAWLKDPFGHKWSFASRTEDVSPEEMTKRFGKLMAT